MCFSFWCDSVFRTTVVIRVKILTLLELTGIYCCKCMNSILFINLKLIIIISKVFLIATKWISDQQAC